MRKAENDQQSLSCSFDNQQNAEMKEMQKAACLSQMTLALGLTTAKCVERLSHQRHIVYNKCLVWNLEAEKHLKRSVLYYIITLFICGHNQKCTYLINATLLL